METGFISCIGDGELFTLGADEAVATLDGAGTALLLSTGSIIGGEAEDINF